MDESLNGFYIGVLEQDTSWFDDDQSTDEMNID